MEALDPILRESLIVAAVLCFPVLAVATICGVVVAVAQAATQIQEQTLTLLPKMIAVAVTLALFGSFAMHLCAALFNDAVSAIPSIVIGS
ncbi:MAG TPA: flagellar biosynthetic protein FliQ [Candidatus Acidoferrales bacterium]|nr:flagellar biosynthetic protein FliQ [Candidatus Acidoferrales bacterium]